MTERWHPIPGWEDLYEASDLGNVRSLDRIVTKPCVHTGAPRQFLYKGKVLAAQVMLGHQARRRFRMYQAANGVVLRNEWVFAAWLVWRAFHGVIPDDMTVDHINNIPTDDRLENLQLLTAFENIAKSHRENGESRRGDRHHNSKLRQQWVDLIIRPALARGCSQSEVARVFDVFPSTINMIAKGEAWKGRLK